MGFILYGDICFCNSEKKISVIKNGYVICENGKCVGTFEKVPDKYKNFEIEDFQGKLIIPGMNDLHIHAPQYTYRALGMDLELMDWLDNYAFPEESKYYDLEYANKAYSIFTNNLKKSATTRASIFASAHTNATLLLMDKLEKSGLRCYVGRVNMNRNAPETLREKDTEFSVSETERWINTSLEKYNKVKPIITPRFLPSCTDDLLEELGKIAEKYSLPIQSHLSENPGEVEFVKTLFPDIPFYGAGYDKYNLFGRKSKTIMAHCIYSSEDEIELMKKNEVFVAHCPASNMNISSGIAPIRKYIEKGLNVGIASDVAGGESESIFRAIRDSIQVSKLYWRIIDQSFKPLTFDDAFYMATMGGGKFFGKVGSFLEGYEFDALVIDDSEISLRDDYEVRERLERAVYLEADRNGIIGKYVQGERII